MEWRTRSRKGRVAAGPTVPRRERRPPRHLRRAYTSNAGAHARRLQIPTMCHDRRATSELGQPIMRTPTAGGPCIMTWTGRSGGTLSPGRPVLRSCRRRRSACGAQDKRSRALRSRAARHCGTERVISPVPLDASTIWGAAGCPRLKGKPETGPGSGSGEVLPPSWTGPHLPADKSTERISCRPYGA